MSINVTIWNEYRHEKSDAVVKAIYPTGIHSVIAAFLQQNPDMDVSTATLDEPEHGLTDDVLARTDVLLWWGHCAHGEVSDHIVEKVYNRVLQGMGLIALHSGHASKIFRKICGTDSNRLSWRDDGELERIFFVEPGHPLAQGLPQYFEVPQTEMYGEYFNIPAPDELIGISWFEGGEVFRSVFTYKRGLGKVVYIKPGHEIFPIYKQPEIQQLITNAVRYAYTAHAPKITYRDNIPLPPAKDQ